MKVTLPDGSETHTEYRERIKIENKIEGNGYEESDSFCHDYSGFDCSDIVLWVYWYTHSTK